MTARLSKIVKRDLGVDPEIAGVTADSRKVGPGFLFAALPGSRADGATFAAKAVEAGAAAVIADQDLNLAVPTIVCRDPRRGYALAAANFWGRQPQTCVAVTGTNGKTSVANFCRQIFAGAGHVSASMGTLGLTVSRPDGAVDQLTPPGLTTPDAGDVAELLARISQMGVTHFAMEASSHGIDQRRLDGVRLAASGFLNLTQDHLDYHVTMDAYLKAKLRLFEQLMPRGATAVLNADNEAFPFFAAASVVSGQRVMSVGETGQALKLLARELLPDGQRLQVRAEGRVFDMRLPLAGDFQASNALVAAGLCKAAGLSYEEAFAGLEKLTGVAGRLQRVGTTGHGGEAYVDYAHTPDGLETVLKALRPHVRGKLVVVFGAGGDRDKTKRPLMGQVAAKFADVAIVTDDNPRTEVAATIRAEVLAGAKGAKEIGDRREAIRAAAAMLQDGDILVVAGKGHEQGQIVGDVVHPFDDVAETARALELVHG
ncbi:MAG: UDP-N-acetylmuramoyl-L-alanyl-D-glutamate--2,6-diaminopimelate ligase [Phenylobacterium sp.]|uniref:UDP-N-acetylmuramoyl-L-alanyl-D-glutamate--2, 6-diaminopimelate ligase n=1 Tax=Phenylobacterium sp. TaxID=1871053 RepID=UPI001A36B358|nr:UDP-N-acetylmuramoyl-L-alanyl-D-glutamate--2,6-diaminopimelate ligase [Phenylobacterium sp.]MBL8552807.1 UDP-N-acetylmuramoyl-L-alanyl-D-glutamate--2,6-diaminopimelate ligase [Phenylobacterium sp.]